MPTKDDVVTAARECVGTPFRHQGRVPGVGLDCVGVVIYAADKLGFEHGELPITYGPRPSHGELERQLEANLCRVQDMQDGDVLLMAFRHEPQHVAVVTGGGASIVHAYAHSGLSRCVEHPLDEEWRGRVRAVYRFKELCNG